MVQHKRNGENSTGMTNWTIATKEYVNLHEHHVLNTSWCSRVNYRMAWIIHEKIRGQSDWKDNLRVLFVSYQDIAHPTLTFLWGSHTFIPVVFVKKWLSILKREHSCYVLRQAHIWILVWDVSLFYLVPPVWWWIYTNRKRAIIYTFFI
jgi:hypothetical protein